MLPISEDDQFPIFLVEELNTETYPPFPLVSIGETARRGLALPGWIDDEDGIGGKGPLPGDRPALGRKPVIPVAQNVFGDSGQEGAEMILIRDNNLRAVLEKLEHGILHYVERLILPPQPRSEAAPHPIVNPRKIAPQQGIEKFLSLTFGHG